LSGLGLGLALVWGGEEDSSPSSWNKTSLKSSHVRQSLGRWCLLGRSSWAVNHRSPSALSLAATRPLSGGGIHRDIALSSPWFSLDTSRAPCPCAFEREGDA